MDNWDYDLDDMEREVKLQATCGCMFIIAAVLIVVAIVTLIALVV